MKRYELFEKEPFLARQMVCGRIFQVASSLLAASDIGVGQAILLALKLAFVAEVLEEERRESDDEVEVDD